MYKKIGIVDDGSKNASFAARVGVEFAKSQKGSLTIMGIMDILTPMKPYFAMGGEKWNEEMDVFRGSFSRDRTRIKKILSEDEKFAKGRGVSSSTMFLEGQPSEQISEQSKRFDLLFVGAYSKSKKRKSEDVSGKLARDCKCDFFVARNEEIREILLALGGSPLDKDVVEKGILFARCFGAHLTALHVVRPLSGNVDKSILRRAKEAGQSADVKIRALMAHGFVSSKILSYAEKSDLVVVRSRGEQGLGDIVLGMLAENISRKAPCSVLVVKSARKRRI